MKNFIEKLSEIFKALSDPSRLRLIRLLAFNDEDKMCVIDLAEKLGISQPAVSQHINVLKKLNIIKLKKEQARTFYFINKDIFRQYQGNVNHLFQMVYQKCPFDGNCETCKFKNYCERPAERS
jgi:ArsR family transcriptional regulator